MPRWVKPHIDVLNILIVKLSSLGDVVHAMPAVQDILQACPEAQIDWVLESAFAPLAARCQGVRRVVACDLRRWRKQPFARSTRAAWRAFVQTLQAQPYDWVIDLQGLSKSALVARCARLKPAGQRVAMANRTEGSGYEAPTRWVAHRAYTLPVHSHAVTRARLLCAQALGYTLPKTMRFGLQALANAGECAIKSIANQSPVSMPAPPAPSRPIAGRVALVHGTSRADKEWPLAHWVALGQQLLAGGWGVDVLHGNDAEEARAHALAQALGPAAQVWPRLGLDALTDRLATCAGVVGVDSGLSHVAVALDLPHVQLYNFDTAWRTGPLLPEGGNTAQPSLAPRQRAVYAQPCPTVAQVWQAWLAVQPGLPGAQA